MPDDRIRSHTWGTVLQYGSLACNTCAITRPESKKKASNPTAMPTSLSLHPAPLQNAEQAAIRRGRQVDADDPLPERGAAVLRSRACGCLLPMVQVARVDAAEEHEDAGNDVWRGRDAHLRRLLVRRLWEEAQRDVFVLEQIRQPISVSPETICRVIWSFVFVFFFGSKK